MINVNRASLIHLYNLFVIESISFFLLLFSVLTDSFCNLDIPIIDVELDGILDLAHISPFRNSVASTDWPKVSREDSEDESTVL